MGLGGRKEKQKLRDDPRNRQWADDQNKFGFKMLASSGWNPQVGLGAAKQGNVNAIKSSYKFDTMGIGADMKKKDDWSGGLEFGNILAKLNKGGAASSPAATSTATPTPTPTPPPSSTSKNVSRSKYRNAKSQLNKDAMREILGVDANGSVPSTTDPSRENSPTEIPTMKNKSNLSIQEYFRVKLLLKYQQAQNAPAVAPLNNIPPPVETPIETPDSSRGSSPSLKRKRSKSIKKEKNAWKDLL
ncbi:hypothetical protein E3P81_00795 [Wallemia ichthyophaga]|nr:hypothetical protein E3P97_00796 [Wallemia ichthyophaga]TIB35067.1 hypothetical protein E3P85_00626 [Wallemia ichthyophaga]TIB49622.1 hypothetical protein E3P82_00793 [Wallemia ichthyophaga]TIB53352.1 hypothetical protein E3P81_00795 [Wallemia ichthyophaga]TIB56117.1 hypothetical protein E3P80_00794 [Wallemia ichthyophaga]